MITLSIGEQYSKTIVYAELTREMISLAKVFVSNLTCGKEALKV